jgi:basic amino acid/polyamine antiporter, APA family
LQDLEASGAPPALPLKTAEDTAERPKLGLWDAVSIIVGIVIGAGIYETAPAVFANAGSPALALGVWLLGGVLSLVGACCYAELASAYPRSGGDYVYLSRAFAPWVGFLFGWAQLVMLMTGSIGMMAYVFSDYAVVGAGLERSLSAPLAAAAATALTVLNLASVTLSKSAQNILTMLKAAGLVAVIIAGVVWAESGAFISDGGAGGAPPSFGLAMVLVLYTYGGWNDAAFVAREVRDRRKNLPRALLLGTSFITLIYLAVNAAFMAGLGFDDASASEAIAADVLSRPLGALGGVAMSALVMISALSAVNALVFTGARVYSSLGADYSALSMLGRWHSRLRSPANALLAQLVVTLALITLVGTRAGRSVIDAMVRWTGGEPVSWAGHGGFDTLLRCTAPVFWAFFLLTSCALFVLRVRDPKRERPFKVPLYPALPAVFSATCLYMLHAAIDYAGALAWIGLGPVLAGVPVYFISRRRPGRPAPQNLGVPNEQNHDRHGLDRRGLPRERLQHQPRHRAGGDGRDRHHTGDAPDSRETN